MKAIIGWDIGGAHLKLARMNDTGQLIRVAQHRCPLWQGLPTLEAALETVLRPEDLDPSVHHAVTMTGELVDAFENRAEGVLAILRTLQGRLGEGPMGIFAGDLGFLPPEGVGLAHTQHIASANWLATGLWVGTQLKDAWLIDIGSTTTDILPITQGIPRYLGYCDQSRLAAGELVYSGVVRTPLLALTQKAPIAGQWIRPMAEFFATTADVYRLTGELKEQDDHYPAADGGPKSPAGSARRLGRQFGVDFDEATMNQALPLARYLREQQLRRISDALAQVLSRQERPDQAPWVAVGVGRFLVKDIAQRFDRKQIVLPALLPGDLGAAADCAPAAAVAALYRMRHGTA